MNIRTAILTGLATLSAGLAVSPAAQAAFKDAQLGSFGSGDLGVPVGVAVDQATHDLYVASLLPQGLDEFSATGGLLANDGSGSFLSGTAVNPVDGDVDVVNAEAQTLETYDPAIDSKRSEFSVAGSANLLEEFTVVQIATDAAGNIYLPNAPHNEVQVFNQSGGAPSGIAATITGAGEHALSAPTGVAVDTAGGIWVADAANGRIEEFDPSGAFVKQISSPGVQALALDAAGNVYAGANSGAGFHVVVYTPAGAQLTEFGLGTIGSSGLGAIDTLAIDQETGAVYVTDGGNDVVWIYGPPLLVPDVTTGTPASDVTTTTATLSGVVDPDAATVTSCRFEYGFSAMYGATAPCSQRAPLTGDAPVAQSVSLVGLQPDRTYHYRLVAANGNGVNDGEDVTFATPSSTPSLDNVSTSTITQTSAVLNASINPNNQDTTYSFDFGASPAYGMTLPASGAAIGSAYGDVVVGQQLTGLTPGTTYHFRVLATNETGRATSVDEAFTTLPPTTPIVATSAAANVTPDAATLSGTVDPRGSQSTYELDLGTDTSYGSRVFGGAGSGSGAQPVAVRVNGLAAATTYHYRILATNTFGTSYGPDETFTTPDVPSSLLAAPATAALVPTPALASPTVDIRAKTHKQTKKNKHKRKKRVGKRSARHTSSNRRGK